MFPLLRLRRRRSIPGLLLSLGLLLGAVQSAGAQTVHRSKARQDADHRRAQRTAQRLESPYKESHLQPGRRLKRGQGDQPRPEGSDQLRFENGNKPRVVQPKFPLGKRRQKADS